MVGLAILAGVLVFGAIAGTFALVMGLVFMVARAALWLVLLPFRLAFLALGLPILLLLVAGFVAIAVVGSLILAAASIVAAVVLPLIPVALVVLFVWALVRLLARPAAGPRIVG